jgi:hypothetical protein
VSVSEYRVIFWNQIIIAEGIRLKNYFSAHTLKISSYTFLNKKKSAAK